MGSAEKSPHHGFELLLAALGIVAALLGWLLGERWLAPCAAVLLWWAFCEYSKGSLRTTTRARRLVIRLVALVILAVISVVVFRLKPNRPDVARVSPPSDTARSQSLNATTAMSPTTQQGNYATPTATPMFATSIPISMMGPGPSGFWVVARVTKTVYPIDAVIALRIVNMGPRPAEVVGFTVDFHVAGGDWMRLIHVPIDGIGKKFGDLYLGPPDRAGRVIPLEPDIYTALHLKKLEPGDTVRAIACFEYAFPLDQEELRAPRRFRVTLVDSVGAQSVSEIGSGMADESTVTSFEALGIKGTGIMLDLTRLKQGRVKGNS